MAPKGKALVDDMSSVGPKSLASPTALTNSIPRPKVARTRSTENKRRSPTSVTEQLEPSRTDTSEDRRRARHQIGSFRQNGNNSPHSGGSTNNLTSRDEYDPVIPSVAMTRKTPSPPGTVPETSLPPPPPKRKSKKRLDPGVFPERAIRGCVRSGAVVSRHLTDCFMVTTDIYRQECSTNYHDRGDDSFFFFNTENDELVEWGVESSVFVEDDNNSLTHSDSGRRRSGQDERRKEDVSRKSMRRMDERRKEERGSAKYLEEELGREERRLEESRQRIRRSRQQHVDQEIKAPPPLRNTVREERTPPEDVPFRSHRSGRFPNAVDKMEKALEEQRRAPSPSRRHFENRPRGKYDVNDDPDLLEHTPIRLSAGVSDLRELRLQLFQQDQQEMDFLAVHDEDFQRESNRSIKSSHSTKSQRSDDVTAVKYSKALNDLAVQNEALKSLHSELQDTRQRLERTRRDLHVATTKSHERATAASEASAQLFRDRLKVDERLRLEMNENARVLSENAKLQDDILQLKAALEEERKKVKTVVPSSRIAGKAAEARAKAEAARLATTVFQLKGEMADMNTKLADTRAAKKAAEGELTVVRAERDGAFREVELLKHRVSGLVNEVDELRKKAAESETLINAEAKELRDTVVRIKEDLGQTKQVAETQARKNERLEEQLTETQSEATNLRDRVSALMQQMDKTKLEADEKVKVTEEEAKSLQAEVSKIKREFHRKSVELATHADAQRAERKALESQLAQAKEAASMLQRKISTMDGRIAESDHEAETLRTQLDQQSDTPQSKASTPAIVKKLSDDVMELLRRKLDSQN